MLKSRKILLALMAALGLSIYSAGAEDRPLSGVYRIISGEYLECCGFIGLPSRQPLPADSQAFVELTIDAGRNVAQMSFLGKDMRTVFSTYPWVPGSEFTFTFSNGMVFPDHVEFAQPGQSYSGYTISNSTDALLINGMVTTTCFCADVPTEFTHANVVAVLMPTTAIRVSEVEVCWNTASNRTYQVQYRSALNTNAWLQLGSPIAGNGFTNCIADKVPLGEPRRFYRVLTVQ